jgi:hypothetical protein
MDRIQRFNPSRPGSSQMVPADDGKWVRHEDVARSWAAAHATMSKRALIESLTGDSDLDMIARAEHAFQAITLKPHDALTHFDVLEAAACIALLGTRLRELLPK